MKWIGALAIVFFSQFTIAQTGEIEVQFPDKMTISQKTYYDVESNKLYSWDVDYDKSELVIWNLWNSIPERTIELEGVENTGGAVVFEKNNTKDTLKIYCATNEDYGYYQLYELSLSNYEVSYGEPKEYPHLVQEGRLNYVDPNNALDGSLGYQKVTGISTRNDLSFSRNGVTYELRIENGNHFNKMEVAPNYGGMTAVTHYNDVSVILIKTNDEYWMGAREFVLEHNTIAAAILPDASRMVLLDADYKTLRIFEVDSSFQFMLIKELETSIPSKEETFGLNFLDNGGKVAISDFHGIEIIDLATEEIVLNKFNVFEGSYGEEIKVGMDTLRIGGYNTVFVRELNEVFAEVILLDTDGGYRLHHFLNECRFGGETISFIVDLQTGEVIKSAIATHHIATDLPEILLSIPCDKSHISFYDANLKKEIKHISLDRSLVEIAPILSDGTYDYFTTGHYNDGGYKVYSWFPFVNLVRELKDSYYIYSFLPETSTAKDKSIQYTSLIVDPGSTVTVSDLITPDGRRRRGVTSDTDWYPYMDFNIEEYSGTSSFSTSSDNLLNFLYTPFRTQLDSAFYNPFVEADKVHVMTLNDSSYSLRKFYGEYIDGSLLIEQDELLLSNYEEFVVTNYVTDGELFRFKTRDSIGAYKECVVEGQTKKIGYITTKGELWSIDIKKETESKVATLPIEDEKYESYWSRNGRFVMCRTLDSTYVYDLLKNKKHNQFKTSIQYFKGYYSSDSSANYKVYEFQGLNVSDNGVPFYFEDKGYARKEQITTKRIAFKYLENDSTAFELMSAGGYWLTALSNGFYYGAPEAVEAITFVKDENAYPYTQFDHFFNRPHEVMKVVSEFFGVENEEGIRMLEKAYEKRLKKTGIAPSNELDNNLPELQIIDKNKLPKAAKIMELELAMSSQNSMLKELVVEVNDVPVLHKILSGKKSDEKVQVELMDGFNLVKVYCRDANGNSSLPEYAQIYGDYEGAEKNLYVLSIGASEYQDQNFNLTYASKDANDFAEQMSQSNVYNEVFTKVLTNEEVTAEHILEAKEFFSGATVLDEVIIFVAGHGVLDENLDYYLATYDMDFNQPNAKGMAYDDLENLLSEIKPLKKVLILDACHSGEIDKEDVELLVAQNTEESDVQFRAVGNQVKSKIGVQNSSELARSIFSDLRTGTGATVISASGGMEFAMESKELQNGLFTFCFLYGIQSGEADLNKDGEVWLKEIQEYVQNEVYIKSGGMQHPTSRIENNTLDYRIW